MTRETKEMPDDGIGVKLQLNNAVIRPTVVRKMRRTGKSLLMHSFRRTKNPAISVRPVEKFQIHLNAKMSSSFASEPNQ